MSRTGAAGRRGHWPPPPRTSVTAEPRTEVKGQMTHPCPGPELRISGMSAADAPGRVMPGSEGGQEGGEAARPGESGDEAVSSRIRHPRLVSSVTALVVVAAAVIGVIIAFAGNSAPRPAGTDTGGETAGHAVVANEAAATVAVVTTGGSITGGP